MPLSSVSTTIKVVAPLKPVVDELLRVSRVVSTTIKVVAPLKLVVFAFQMEATGPLFVPRIDDAVLRGGFGPD